MVDISILVHLYVVMLVESHFKISETPIIVIRIIPIVVNPRMYDVASLSSSSFLVISILLAHR